MELRKCIGCGIEFEIDRYQTKKIWCSNRCRKRTLYSKPCIDCGALTNGTTPSKAKGRCQPCASKHETEKRRNERRELGAKIIAMRKQGYLNWVIEEELGLKYNTAANTLSRLRAEGVDVPRSPYFTADV